MNEDVEEDVEAFAELVLLEGVFEGLVEILAVEFVDLEEEVLDFFLVELLAYLVLEDGEELHFGDGVEGVDGVLAGEVVDGVDLSQVLAGLLDQFLIEEVEAGVGVQLDVEIVDGGPVGFEEEGLVVLVDDEEVVEVRFRLHPSTQYLNRLNYIYPSASLCLKYLY